MSGLFGGLNLFGGAPAPAPEPFGGFAGDEDEAAAAFEEFDLGRLGSLPAADASSDDDGDRIEVDCDGRTEVISGLSLLSCVCALSLISGHPSRCSRALLERPTLLTPLAAVCRPQQVSQRLSDTFGSPRRTSGGGGFILRDVHGVVCPVSPELQPGRCAPQQRQQRQEQQQHQTSILRITSSCESLAPRWKHVCSSLFPTRRIDTRGLNLATAWQVLARKPRAQQRRIRLPSPGAGWPRPPAAGAYSCNL